MWKKEKMLVTSIFSFSRNVLKKASFPDTSKGVIVWEWVNTGYTVTCIIFIVDLATVDPISDQTEHQSSQTVSSLVQAYKTHDKDSSGSSSHSSGSDKSESKGKEQWPVLAMFRNLENQPGSLKQFWILYRLV